MSSGPLTVFIGDDFTGASDTLATWARSGVSVRLFLDAEKAVRPGQNLDVIGIATELRGLSAAGIAARASTIAETIARLKPDFVHYKVCSTFDSGSGIGSIGAAVREFERALQPCLTLVIGGQPSLGRYCLFGNLFARAADGLVYRIDRHPVMRRHPVTPMTEADLSEHLAAQGLDGLQSVPFTLLAVGPDALVERLQAGLAAGPCRFLLDVSSAADIDVIGQALRGLAQTAPVLLVGASSVAEALRPSGSAPATATATAPIRQPAGACFVVAGSRSCVTEAQVSAANAFDKYPLSPETLAEPARFEELVDRVSSDLQAGRNVLVHTLPGSDYHIGAPKLTDQLVAFVSAVLARAPIGRLGIAGGDTSSAICQRLGFSALEFESDLDPGVSICIGRHADPGYDGMRLMLKGGQMGRLDLFDRFAGGAQLRHK